MIDNYAKAMELMHKMEAQLPIPVRPSRALIGLMRGRGIKLARGRKLQIKRLFYHDDAGGIVCDVTPSPDAKEAIIVSIIHLRVDARHPLAREIRAYQRERTRRLAQVDRPREPSEFTARPRKKRTNSTVNRLLDKVRRLRQSETTWLCTARRAPAWITPPDQPPYRPYVVFVLEQETDLVWRNDFQKEPPIVETVLKALLETMQRPPSVPISMRLAGFGRRTRPARIILDDADLVEALAPQLAEIDIRCDYRPSLPPVDAALREMEAYMTEQEPLPGLLSVRGVTEPLVRELWAAAADYYRQTPWRWMNNSFPIEVRYPPDGRMRYAVVLGSGGEVFGLSFYQSLRDLRMMYSGAEAGEITSVGVVFGEAMLISFDDLDAMAKYGWPVAGEKAYPLAIKGIPPDVLSLPTASELAWLAATLRVIPDFVIRHLRADQGPPRPAKATYPLPNVHAGQRIALGYPVNLLEPDSPELEGFIQDWYWDEPSHELARQMGAFLYQFMVYLETTGLSRRTLDKHFYNCWCIGKFQCDYGHLATFSPAIFGGEPLFLTEFRRKVSDSKYAIASYKATWRKLARYVRWLGYEV